MTSHLRLRGHRPLAWMAIVPLCVGCAGGSSSSVGLLDDWLEPTSLMQTISAPGQTFQQGIATAPNKTYRPPLIGGKLKNIRSAGPRFGVVSISGPDADEVREEMGDLPNGEDMFLSAWGWQFEYEYLATGTGMTGLVEFVPLVLGLDKSLVIPSMSVLIGVRSQNGIEFGAGPNVSPSGVGLAAAFGFSLRAGEMAFPFNLAVVLTGDSTRASFLVGWKMRQGEDK